MSEESINIFKGYLARRGHTQEDAADLIGCTVWTFNKKLNGRGTEFTRNEMLILIKEYNISKADVIRIFLTEKCLEQDK